MKTTTLRITTKTTVTRRTVAELRLSLGAERDDAAREALDAALYEDDSEFVDSLGDLRAATRRWQLLPAA